MTHTFRDRDIDEIYVITSSKEQMLHISYLGAIEETFFTRADILRMLEIIDGAEKGVMRK